LRFGCRGDACAFASGGAGPGLQSGQTGRGLGGGSAAGERRPVALRCVIDASQRLLCHPFEGQYEPWCLLRAVRLGQGRERGQRPLRPAEPAVHLGRVQQQALVIRHQRETAMEIGQRGLVLPPRERHLPTEMPGFR